MSPEEYKALGNKAFAAKDFKTAIEHFDKAIELSPAPNHVLYSNRSACYASQGNYDQALEDANKCVEINSSWAKGYNRIAAAAYGLGKLDDAAQAYQQALQLDPANKMAKDGLSEVEKAKQRPDFGFMQKFADPNLIEKLKNNPKTADAMRDPSVVEKVRQLQLNPSSVKPETFLSNQKLLTVFTTLLGLDLPEPGSAPEAGGGAAPSTKKEEPKKEELKPKQAESKPAAATKSNDDPETSAPDVEMKEPESSAEGAKNKADKIKAEANTLYKKRQFDEAIELYNKAYETHPDITYLNNRAAAEFEKGEYQTAIKTCELAIEKGREVRADYKIIAKSFARIGSSYLKLDDLRNAIQFFDKSLTEHRTADVLTKLRTTEKALKKKEAEEYINPEKAEEARLEGKEYFTKADWPNAVKAYSEMIKRAPEDPRGYSNRAAAFVKLLSFPDAVRDCDAAIDKDPNFIRAYIRKASAQLTMKEFSSCIDTLDKARDVDAKSNSGKSAYEINQLYQKAMSQRFSALEGETEEQTRARISRDPEVVGILQDPVMQGILQQASDNPAALQDHMKNPVIFKKINTLIAAGVIRTA